VSTTNRAATAGVFKVTAPGSPTGSDSPSFRLDEIGSSRAARYSNQKAPRRRVFDLFEGPARRTGRRGGGGGGGSSSSALKDARVPLLGMLDDLGDRVSGRSSSGSGGGSVGRRGVGGGGRSGAVVQGGIGKGAVGSAAATAASLFGDMFEAPGRRVRRSEKTRAVRAAAKNGHGNASSSSAAAAAAAAVNRKDEVLLGLLSGPSDRAGRAGRSAKRAAAGAVNAPLLGILSGPGKRTGRRGRDTTSIAKV
jgi:hypothetical protein